MDILINKNNELVSRELTNYLSNLADIELTFSGNLAGYSKDIDGQVYIHLKLKVNITLNKVNEEKECNLRYKIKENSINFFLDFII